MEIIVISLCDKEFAIGLAYHAIPHVKNLMILSRGILLIENFE